MIRNIYGDRFRPTKQEMIDAVNFNLPEYTPLDGLTCPGRLMKNAIIETIERGCYLGARAWWEIQTGRFGWRWRQESTGHHTDPITGQDRGPLFHYWRIGFLYIRHWRAAEEPGPPEHPNCRCTVIPVDDKTRAKIEEALRTPGRVELLQRERSIRRRAGWLTRAMAKKRLEDRK